MFAILHIFQVIKGAGDVTVTLTSATSAVSLPHRSKEYRQVTPEVDNGYGHNEKNNEMLHVKYPSGRMIFQPDSLAVTMMFVAAR